LVFSHEGSHGRGRKGICPSPGLKKLKDAVSIGKGKVKLSL
jgi:hypothetical protein